MLASLLLLAGLTRSTERESGRRLLDRSLLYAALTALLSAGFLLGVLSLVGQGAEPLVRQYRFGALFVVFMAALAVDPLRRTLQQALGGRLLSTHARSEDLAAALAEQERRVDQAERLAELGRFASAVAHEVRNPLGVITANVHLLEQGGADRDVCAAIAEQVDRADRFVTDLLTYGRPRPLELDMLDPAAVVCLARSTVVSALGDAARGVSFEGFEELPRLVLEADREQLMQVFVVLIDNAVRAVRESGERRVRATASDGESVVLAVEDTGPGIPEAIGDRLFEPFVTGRKRSSGGGTGLGLAIARAIVLRHGGAIEVGASSLGGAKFSVRLPKVQPVLGRPSSPSKEVPDGSAA